MKTPIALLLFLMSFPAPGVFAQPDCDTLRANAALERSIALSEQGLHPEAIQAALNALESTKDCNCRTEYRDAIFLNAIESYQTAATDFTEKGLFNRSIDMSERCIALLRQRPGQFSDQLAKTYLSLGSAQNLNGNSSLAIESGIKGLSVRQSANPLDSRIGSHYDQIIGYCLSLFDTSNARYYLLQWEAFHRRMGGKASLQGRINLANYWSTYYELRGETEKGIRILEDTLALYGEKLRAKGGFVGIAEFRLCELYAQIHDFRKSLHYAEKNVALFEDRIRQQRGKLFSSSHYAWCLAQSGRAAWNLFLETKDSAWFNLAGRRCDQAEDLIFSMRDRAPDDGFRDWIANEVGIVANLAEVRQGMYSLTGDQRNIERSFESVEASKLFAVQSFLHDTYALQWGGLPDSLFLQENAYRNQVNDLETNFFMVRTRSNADSLIAANDQQLFDLRDRYRVFLDSLETHYPEYFRLKYSHPVTRIEDIQTKILHKGQCLLDIFIENSLVFALLIRPDTVVWRSTPFNSDVENALEVLNSESQHFAAYQNLPETEYLNKLRLFADAAHRAYQALIGPLRNLMTEEVLLIPRDELANLPFGALLTQPETDLSKPFRWHFLENELVISQAYSAGLFQFVQNRPPAKTPPGSVLAMAPFFEGNISATPELPAGDKGVFTRSGIFEPLPHSGSEARWVAQLNQGQAFIGPDATKGRFLKQCPDFRIIHLATHSGANNVLGEYSFVAFQPENNLQNIDLLYARDIYGLHLSADLVVLSACETALGQYRKDEGMVGLTRAFTCAGARNVVASLWSVNDASTRALMLLFYQEIRKGLPYNRALANAKRAFIRENRQYAHPYYWAGFILNGR